MTNPITNLTSADLHDANLSLNDTTVVVTGAADGIGRAVTNALASQGARVVMVDRKTRHLETLHDSICDSGFTQPVIAPLDLNDLTPESATQFAQQIYNEFNQLDGLLHIAGELGSPSPLDQYDMTYWDKVMQVNLHAPFLLTRALLPVLKQAPCAQVLFTTADVGIKPTAYWGAYAIAYAGVEAQMRLWHEEQNQISNVSFNSVDPGPVRTALRRRSHPGEDQASLTTPAQIAPFYTYLAGAKHNLNGQHVRARLS